LLARLLDHRDVLVQVTVPPGSAPDNAPPVAMVERAGDPPVRLTLLSPAPRTDPRVQGTSYFYRAPADQRLMPGMDVAAILPVGGPLDGVGVPATSLVWHQGRAWIYLQTAPDRFVRRPVATERRTVAGDIFSDTISPSARAVIQGGQLLLSEELRAQIKVGEP
jgi:hypothetical protein